MVFMASNFFHFMEQQFCYKFQTLSHVSEEDIEFRMQDYFFAQLCQFAL